MLPVLLGALGVSGALYLLLNLWWPGWYLDWYYRRCLMRVTAGLTDALAKKKFLIDVFEDFVKATPNKAFIIFNDKKFSYEEMDKMANKTARACAEIGIKPGAIIAIMIYNEPAIIWTYLGLMKMGYQIAFINFNLRTHSLAHSINSSGAKVLIVGQGDELTQAVQEVLPELRDVTVYVQGGAIEQKPPPFLSFDLVMSRVSSDGIDKSVRNHVLPFTTNVFIYTSGTTGLPKPAVITHLRTIAAGNVFNSFGMTADDVVYESLPMYHSAALMVGFANTVNKGATMVLRSKFSAHHFWDDCRKHNVTIIQYIGEICRYLVAQPRSKDDGVHNIKIAFGNGLRQDIWEEFKNRFKIPRVLEFYGATEGPVGMTNLTNKVGACGRSSPYLRKFTPAAFVKFDLEAQAPLRNKQGFCVPIGPDEVGLLIVPLLEGRTFFQGYRKKEDTDKKILTDVFVKGDRYYNSGDLLRVDKEYYIYFSDRVGDTFRWKGENVSTTEVSNILTDLDFVHDACVYGVLVPGTDGRAGMAALHLNDPGLPTLMPSMLTTLSQHVRQTLPVYARPRFIRIQKELSMTSTFKQQKTVLVQEGFDVTSINDPLFYWNSGTQSYMPLDYTVYTQIMAGKVPL